MPAIIHVRNRGRNQASFRWARTSAHIEMCCLYPTPPQSQTAGTIPASAKVARIRVVSSKTTFASVLSSRSIDSLMTQGYTRWRMASMRKMLFS